MVNKLLFCANLLFNLSRIDNLTIVCPEAGFKGNVLIFLRQKSITSKTQNQYRSNLCPAKQWLLILLKPIVGLVRLYISLGEKGKFTLIFVYK